MSLAIIETVKSAIITEIESYFRTEERKSGYNPYNSPDTRQTQDYMRTLKTELEALFVTSSAAKSKSEIDDLKKKIKKIIDDKIIKVDTATTATYYLTKVLIILEQTLNLYESFGFNLITQEQLNKHNGLNIVNKLIADYLLIKAVEQRTPNTSVISATYNFVKNSATALRKAKVVNTLIENIRQLEQEKMFQSEEISNASYLDTLALRLREAKELASKESSGGILIPLLDKLIEAFPNTIAEQINSVKETSFAFLTEKSIADKKEQASEDTSEEESEESEQEEILATTSAKKESTETTPAEIISKIGTLASNKEKEKPVLSKAQKRRAKQEKQAAASPNP